MFCTAPRDEFSGRLVGDGLSGRRMVLAPGHGGRAVVENDDQALGFIVDRIDQAGDAGMDKGRIADTPAIFLPGMARRNPS